MSFHERDLGVNDESHKSFLYIYKKGTLLNLCRLRISQSACSGEESFGSTEVEIHVQTHGNVVFVVGDVERDDFLFFAVFFFKEGEDEASIRGGGVFDGEIFLSFIDNALPLAVSAVCHEEVDSVTLLPSGGVEGACFLQHANHVITAIFAGVTTLYGRLRVFLIAHLHAALSVGITVPHFISAIGSSLECFLDVVLRNKVKAGVCHEGVSHDKEFICFFGTSGDEVGTPGGFAVIDGLRGVHGSSSHFHPHEFPVEVEVINQRFSAFKGTVGSGALCLYLRSMGQE